MGIAHAGLEADAHARCHGRFAGVGAQHKLAFQQVKKFVDERVPVPQRRLCARLERFQTDAELREPERVA